MPSQSKCCVLTRTFYRNCAAKKQGCLLSSVHKGLVDKLHETALSHPDQRVRLDRRDLVWEEKSRYDSCARGSINPRGLSAETKETLRAALERARCGRDADVIRATFPPESVKDLKQLLSNRCNAITGIVASSKSPLSRDTIILLELHISYLRLTVAYL
jgi:hypothetical protein